jgi:hypothetical protein
MALPAPEPGLVIWFNYLWRRERASGRDNARYARPCAIVLAHRDAGDGLVLVMVAPITHAQPDERAALQLPPRVKRHLGLDDQPSWIVTDEVNEFVWPGFDLAADEHGEVAIGYLPPRLFDDVRDAILASARSGRLGRVPR